MAILNKITFNDKENFVNTNSIYVLNGDNINEIKSVTNNLIDEFIATNFKFNDIFKFIVISFKDLKYFSLNMHISLKFSTSSLFTSFAEINSKTKPEYFYVFSNGEYKHLNEVNEFNEDSILLIDISKINEFENSEKYLSTYYCKYYVYNDSYKSEEFSFVLGNNDYFEKFKEEYLTLSIPNSIDNNILKYDKSLLKSIEKINYPLINEDSIKTYLIKSNDVIDVTEFTTYSLRKENKNIILENNIIKCKNNYIKSIDEVVCTTEYDEHTYVSKLNIELSKEYQSKFDIKLKIDSIKILPNELYNFDIEFVNGLNKILYSEHNEFFTISYDKKYLTIEDTSLSSNFNKESILLNIDILFNDGINSISKSFPLFLENDSIDFIKCNFERKTFFKATKNNEFLVFKNVNNELIDITNDDSLDICVLSNILNDENEYIINFDKASKSFDINEFQLNKEILVLFKYYDNNLKKYFYTYESIILNQKLKINDILVTFPHEIKLNDKLVYSVVGKYKDEEENVEYNIDLTNKIDIHSSSNCLLFNDGIVEINKRKLDCVCKLHDYQDIVFIHYKENDKNFDRIVNITLKYRQYIGLTIKGDTILSGGIKSNPYNVSLIYDDGTITDVSESTNLFLSINEDGNSILDDLTLTPGLSHSPYNIILNARYEDETCLNKTLESSLNVYVLPYNLIKTTLNGDEEIQTNITKKYTTDAYYSNGWIIKNVFANYLLSDISGNAIDPTSIISPVTFNFINTDEDENTLEIYAKKSLIDKQIIISSYYEEPDYEDTENYLVSKEILIKGGFDINLSGQLLIYNQENDELEFINFNSETSEQIKSINNTSFKNDFILTDYVPSANIKFTNLKNLNTSNTNYHLIDIVDENNNVVKLNYEGTMIFSPNKLVETNLKKSKKYQVRFYDILKSSKLSDHPDYINNVNNLSIHDDVICSYASFDINKSIDDSYILGLSDLYFEDGFYPLYIVTKFETSNGVEYINEFSFNKENNMWIINDVPLKASKLKNILIAFAFRDNEI